MRSLLVALAAAVLACHSAATPPTRSEEPQKTTMRVLKSGSYGRAASSAPSTGTPAVLLATSNDDYQNLWRQHIDDGPIPPVDFTRETVVFLLLGSRSSGGYGINPSEATVEADVAKISAPVTVPGADSIVTMAFTAPFSVVAVSKAGLGAAEWHDRDRVVARADRRR